MNRNIWITLAFLVLTAPTAFAKTCLPPDLTENNGNRSAEQLKKIIEEQRSQSTPGSLKGQNRLDGQAYDFNYVKFRGAKEAHNPVVISPGFGEYAGMYAELAHDLAAKGYGPIYVIDHRGQGSSPEIVANQGSAAYVDKFDFMAKDLLTLIQWAKKENSGIKPHVIGHSMGGGIAARPRVGSQCTRTRRSGCF
jgi:pimeloyl-ACP methyl ester carboxylesterase